MHYSYLERMLRKDRLSDFELEAGLAFANVEAAKAAVSE